MAHNQAQWISHRITGGWATDFGTTFYGSPDQGELNIPWLTQAENIRFHPDGSIGKHPGFSTTTVPINAPTASNGLLGGTRISAIYSYSREPITTSTTTTSLAVVGGFLYNISSITAPSLIGETGQDAFHPVTFSTFNDLLIQASGFSAPNSWDGTTFQSLAGTPPSFGFSVSHANRQWAAGNTAAPSRLYYSVSNDPEDWVGVGSGSIDIDPGDGDGIVALLSWKSELWVFKGHEKLSIHRISGTTTSDFVRKIFVTGISAAGPTSIFPVGDDFAFWSPRGSCHSLTNTANFGDYSQGYFNYPILSWCQNSSNILRSAIDNLMIQTVTDYKNQISYVVFNNSIQGPLKKYESVIGMDWKFRNESNPYPRFFRLTGKSFSSVGMLQAPSEVGQYSPCFGDYEGIFYKEYLSSSGLYLYSTGVTTTSENIPVRIKTPTLTYGPSVYKKSIFGIGIDLMSSRGSGNVHFDEPISVSVGGYGAPAQTFEFDPNQYARLGTFILTQDQLGNDRDTPMFREDVTGEATGFTYTFVSDTDASIPLGQGDCRFNTFKALIAPSGESMEIN